MATKLVQYYEAFTAWMLAASPVDRAMGLVWYSISGRKVVSEASVRGYSEHQACAIFASLSANVRLDGNWRLFRQFIATGHAATVPCAIDGALRAATLQGMDSITAITVSGSKAFKTKCFARCLLAGSGAVSVSEQYNPQYACLDRWMHRAATGDLSLMPPPSALQYPVMAQALAMVALDNSIPVWQAQAIIWCAIQTSVDVNWMATDPIISAYRAAPVVTRVYARGIN